VNGCWWNRQCIELMVLYIKYKNWQDTFEVYVYIIYLDYLTACLDVVEPVKHILISLY